MSCFASCLSFWAKCANIGTGGKKMSNVKHKNCIVRQLAKSAKSRLCKNDYEQEVAPTGATPEQKEIYLKLCKLQKDGETVTNPVASFADPEKLKTLSHEEKHATYSLFAPIT